MPTPQQPELRRSGDNAVRPGGPDDKVAAPSKPEVGGETGPVPADNLPGHHPAEEQDKPDPDEFVARAKEQTKKKKAPATKAPARKAPASKAPPTTTPPSSAPVAGAPRGAAGARKPSDEAAAPRATKSAVAAEATTGARPGDASPPPCGGTHPLVTVAALPWKVATIPVRVAIGVAGKLRRLL